MINKRGVANVRVTTRKRNDIGRRKMPVQAVCLNAFAAAVILFVVFVWVAMIAVILDEE